MSASRIKEAEVPEGEGAEDAAVLCRAASARGCGLAAVETIETAVTDRTARIAVFSSCAFLRNSIPPAADPGGILTPGCPEGKGDRLYRPNNRRAIRTKLRAEIVFNIKPQAGRIWRIVFSLCLVPVHRSGRAIFRRLPFFPPDRGTTRIAPSSAGNRRR